MSQLTVSDLRSKAEYEAIRPDLRRAIIATKRKRFVPVGGHCTLHFENRDTMAYQIHEMLRAEDSWTRPGAADDELRAYNPLIPSPGELSATLMIEYESAEERQTELPKYVGIDQHVWLQIGDTPRVLARFDRGQIDERGVSSVQYLKWHLTPDLVEALGTAGTVVRVIIDHPAYSAQSVVAEETRQEIAGDPR